jgi:serpin B
MKRLVCCLLALLSLPLAARGDERSAKVVKGNTEFALELYGKLRAQKGNLFLSPFSISTALAMTSAGARGKTLEQMNAVLHLLGQKELHPALAWLMKRLNAPGKKRGYQLRTANALWGQKGYPFRRDFLKLTRDHYDAGFRQADFAGNVESARRTINRWVEKQTNNKIKDLLKPGVLNYRTRLVLTNAIYFKGDWASQFKKDKTRRGNFSRAPGKAVRVPLMRQTGTFPYYGTETFQVLEMPYVGQDLSMVVLLPRKVGGLADLEKDLTAEKLEGWLKKLARARVDVTLPKCTVTSAFSLARTLYSLGMRDAFNQKVADFSGIEAKKELFLSAVVHKAFVEVNEKGTEAAAATGVRAGLKSGRPRLTRQVFKADRPFVFLIRDRLSGSVLFLGRLVNPK